MPYNEVDRQQRLYVAKEAEKLRKGLISRREFIRRAAIAGFGFTSVRFLSGCAAPVAAPTAQQAAATAGPASAVEASTPQQQFLKEVGSQFAGTTIRIASESTPPSRAIDEIMRQEFIPLTGINVEWEQLPLGQVLAKLSQDTAGGLGTNDIYYLDQAWIGRFVNDLVSPTELVAKTDLAYPDYNFDDFLPALVENISTYKGQVASFPYDIPIFITMYRKDIYDELGLTVPTTLEEYMENARIITEAKSAEGTYGSTAQWRSGHYSLECNWTMWHWLHGGNIYNADETSNINSEEGMAAGEYMMELAKYMPSGVTAWEWSAEADSFAQGAAGHYTSWGEFFPSFDDPATSKIVGMAEPAKVPAPLALKAKAECGFDETPGGSHQGGSSLGVSKYSKNIDAAWIFLQWATSPDIVVRASLLGGGATPTRKSTFTDPRIVANNKVMVGTTRAFDVTLDAIENHMGTEPHLPEWAALSGDGGPLTTELAKMTTGQQDVKTTLDNMTAACNDAVAAIKRNRYA
jgi:multiple sugar transport system substrate-binding protein